MKDIIGPNAHVIRTKGSEIKNSPHNIPLSALTSEEKEKVHEILKQAYQNPDVYVMTACTIKGKKRSFTKKFASWHDYSIRKVDYKNNKITIANPWNTSKTKTLTIDEFMDNFESIAFVEI